MSPQSAVNNAITGRFTNGNSGYQLRKQARLSIEAALQAEYDFTTQTAAILLPVIVGHLFDSTRARSKNDRVRASNAARRLLLQIPRREAFPCL